MQKDLRNEPEAAAAQEAIFDPQHSRPLNTAIQPEDPALLGLIHEIWDTHFAAGEAGKQKGGKKPRMPFVDQLGVVITDLYLAWREDPLLCLGMPFSEGGWNSQSRYNPLGLSKQVVVLVKRLLAVGLVRVSAGSYAGPGAKGNRTGRIQASSVLQKRFEELAVDPGSIREVLTECIVLKGNDGKEVEYEDTKDTHRMRAVLGEYNSLLAQTFIDIPTLEEPWVTREDGSGRTIRVGVGPRYQRVRRIFSRESWKMNGRFYGPWWQGLGSGLRSEIFINDTPTVEIDFKGMHVQILAAQQGKDLPEDPYELPEGQFPGIKQQEEQRKLVKLLVLTALNAKDLKGTCSAFRDDLEAGHPGKRLKNADLKAVLDRLVERVPVLQGKLCSDLGIGLMYTDSLIMEKVIRRSTAIGLPVLTVHDSVIVPYTKTRWMQEQMKQAAEEVLGRELPVEAYDRGLDDWDGHARHIQLNFEAFQEVERTEGYLGRLAAWEKANDRVVRPYRFIGGR